MQKKNISAKKYFISDGVEISESARINCDELHIGRKVVIGDRVNINCKGKVYIDDCVYLSHDVSIASKSAIIGEYTKIHNHTSIYGPNSIFIGHNCWIGQNCVLNTQEKLTLGNGVGIGTYSSVWTHGFFGELIEGANFNVIEPVVLEDNSWLFGSNNVVFPGVTLGEKSVVISPSTVTKSVPANRVFAGSPARDITEKIGPAYTAIDKKKKIDVLIKVLLGTLKEKNITFSFNNLEIKIDGMGEIWFDLLDKNLVSKFSDVDKDLVVFIDKVENWDVRDNVSLFCLSSKKYKKQFTNLEILVRQSLNVVAARFNPFV